MQQPLIVSTGSDVPAIRERVLDGLRRYNERFLGPSEYLALCVTAHDDEGALIGGAVGGIWQGRLMVDLVWIDEPHRGKGFGSRMLGQIEAEARDRGATGVFLDTFEFQAAPFYEKQGYVEVARIPQYFGEYDRIYLRKDLA